MDDTGKRVALHTFIHKIMCLPVNMLLLPESVLKYKTFSKLLCNIVMGHHIQKSDTSIPVLPSTMGTPHDKRVEWVWHHG